MKLLPCSNNGVEPRVPGMFNGSLLSAESTHFLRSLCQKAQIPFLGWASRINGKQKVHESSVMFSVGQSTQDVGSLSWTLARLFLDGLSILRLGFSGFKNLHASKQRSPFPNCCNVDRGHVA